jgi:hypothetical protein
MRDSLRNPKLKAAAALAAVFLLGGGTGYFAGYWHAMSGLDGGGWRGRAAAPRGEDRYAARTDRFLRKLKDDLQLTDEQGRRAEDILRRHHERFVQLRQEMAPRIDGILTEVRTELRSVMGPGQREHFDEMVQRMEEHRHRWRDRRWGPSHRGMGPSMMRERPGAPRESQ